MKQIKKISSPFVTLPPNFPVKTLTHMGWVVIYCRSEKKAKQLYLKYFGHHYNPNNKRKGIVYKEGYLAIIRNKEFVFNLKAFWTSYGYYPVLMFRNFYGKSKYNRWIPNAAKFIHDCLK